MLKKLIPKPLRKKLHQLKMERDQQRFTPYSIHREFYGRDCEIYIADPMAKAW